MTLVRFGKLQLLPTVLPMVPEKAPLIPFLKIAIIKKNSG